MAETCAFDHQNIREMLRKFCGLLTSMLVGNRCFYPKFIPSVNRPCRFIKKKKLGICNYDVHKLRSDSQDVFQIYTQKIKHKISLKFVKLSEHIP